METGFEIQKSELLADFLRICRLCLSKSCIKVDIFKDNQSEPLPVRITACTSLEVNLSDQLPKQICENCHSQLEKFYVFRERCKISDRKLRRYYRQLNVENISQVFENSDNEEKSSNIFVKRKVISVVESVHQPEHDFTDMLKILSKSQVKNEPDTDIFAAENIEQMTDELENSKQNDNQFSVKQEPEVDLGTLVINMNDSVQYEEKDNNCANDKKYKSTINNDISALNCNSKVPISMERGQTIFPLNSEKSNHRIIRLTSKEDVTDLATETDPNNVTDKPIRTDDIDFDILTTTVRLILADQAGLNVQGDEKFKILKRRNNLAEVEIRTESENNILIEVELNSMLKDNSSVLKTFRCTQCPRSYSLRSQLKRHILIHKKEKYVSCEHCEKLFPTKDSLDRHILIHTGEKPFKCEYCDKTFHQKAVLKRHIMIHTGERPFKCEFCDKSFIRNDLLQCHITRMHSENPVVKLRKCPLCSKTFSYASGLSRHLAVHTGKIFSCLYCSKKYNDRFTLKQHVNRAHRLLNTNS